MSIRIEVEVSEDQVADAAYLGVTLEQQFQDVLRGNTLRAQDRRLGVIREKASALPDAKVKEILEQVDATVNTELEKL